MDNGRICEVGTHVELMKNKGNYYYMIADGLASIEGAQELSDKIDAGEELTDDDLNSMGVKAIDDYTLEVKTTVRVSFFDELMAFPCFFPISSEYSIHKCCDALKNAKETVYILACTFKEYYNYIRSF